MHAEAQPSPMRRFDPVRLGGLECEAWVAYYRRDWRRVLTAAVGMVRTGFRMSWGRTLYGAALVLRANQVWAPYPHNRPDRARRLMERFYRLVASTHDETFDVVRAAELEVEWWRVHRHGQRDDPEQPVERLVDALTALYAHVYREPPARVRPAAQARAEAMTISDEWVASGADLASPSVRLERAALVRSYALLLGAVHRLPGDNQQAVSGKASRELQVE
jgi:hypothetical protein